MNNKYTARVHNAFANTVYSICPHVCHVQLLQQCMTTQRDATDPLKVLLDLDVLRVADDADLDELDFVVVVVPVVGDVDGRVVGRLAVEERRAIDAHHGVDRLVRDRRRTWDTHANQSIKHVTRDDSCIKPLMKLRINMTIAYRA